MNICALNGEIREKLKKKAVGDLQKSASKQNNTMLKIDIEIIFLLKQYTYRKVFT